MAKSLKTLHWVESLLPQNCLRKAMFGGFAYYLDQKLILVMFESEGNFKHKDKKFNFELWNGCMFPAEKDNHQLLLKKHSYLINHPVLPKWLYLPQATENFDSRVEDVLKDIKRRPQIFGTYSQKKKTQSKVKNKTLKVNTRKPQMFSDVPAEIKLKTAVNISDLKNLGPVSEVTFKKIGITKVSQFAKLGWQKTMVLLAKSNKKHIHSLYAYALIGALKNQDWNAISEEDRKKARDFVQKIRINLKGRQNV